jgi:hypothetical protein
MCSLVRSWGEFIAASVGGFSVLDNHQHLFVRLDTNDAGGWSDEEVMLRWDSVFTPRRRTLFVLPSRLRWERVPRRPEPVEA